MKEEIINIIQDINPYIDITDDMDLIEEDVLDSIGIVLLMQQLEETFGVSIPQESVEVSDFKSIDTIIDLIERLSEKKEN